MDLKFYLLHTKNFFSSFNKIKKNYIDTFKLAYNEINKMPCKYFLKTKEEKNE